MRRGIEKCHVKLSEKCQMFRSWIRTRSEKKPEACSPSLRSLRLFRNSTNQNGHLGVWSQDLGCKLTGFSLMQKRSWTHLKISLASPTTNPMISKLSFALKTKINKCTIRHVSWPNLKVFPVKLIASKLQFIFYGTRKERNTSSGLVSGSLHSLLSCDDQPNWRKISLRSILIEIFVFACSLMPI